MPRRMSRMRDYARRRMRDRRNPYGSRGGYVVADRERGRYGTNDYYGMGDYNNSPEYRSTSNYSQDFQSDYARYRRDGEYNRQYDRHYAYPMNDYYMDYARRGRRDYGEVEELSDEELMEWSKDLLHEVEEKDKAFLTRENIIQRAKDMGIRFKDFTEDEMVVTTLMMYTDYSKTLGTGNMDLYIRLAKDWLEDDDVEVMGSEKLATYYDEIVCGD